MAVIEANGKPLPREWGATESTPYAGHYWGYCTSPGWEESMENSMEWVVAGNQELGGNLLTSTFSATNVVWLYLEPNSGHGCSKVVTNRLSYNLSNFEICSCPETLPYEGVLGAWW
jgi:hypothetical protein